MSQLGRIWTSSVLERFYPAGLWACFLTLPWLTILLSSTRGLVVHCICIRLNKLPVFYVFVLLGHLWSLVFWWLLDILFGISHDTVCCQQLRSQVDFFHRVSPHPPSYLAALVSLFADGAAPCVLQFPICGNVKIHTRAV